MDAVFLLPHAALLGLTHLGYTLVYELNWTSKENQACAPLSPLIALITLIMSIVCSSVSSGIGGGIAGHWCCAWRVPCR